MEFRKLALLFLLVISLTVDAAAQTSLELGVSAHLTMDSATSDKLGTVRWRLGAASGTISPGSWGLVGGLVTSRHSAHDGLAPKFQLFSGFNTQFLIGH